MKRCDGNNNGIRFKEATMHSVYCVVLRHFRTCLHSLPCTDIEFPVHNVCAFIQLFTALHSCAIPLKTSSRSLSLVTPHITAPATSSSSLLECMQMATPDNTNITPSTALPGLSTFSPNNALVMLENTMAVALHIGTDRVRLDDANVL